MAEEQPNTSSGIPQYSLPAVKPGATKYEHLLAVIDEVGKDVKPTYTGNKVCSERLKRNIVNARVLIREVLLEVERDRQKANAEALKAASAASASTSSQPSTSA